MLTTPRTFLTLPRERRRLRGVLIGKPESFRSHSPDEELAARVTAALARVRASDPTVPPRVLLGRQAFTTHVASPAAITHIPGTPVWRSRAAADGVATTGTTAAIGLTLADCLAVVLTDGARLVVLHGSRKTLLPPSGDSIVHGALREAGLLLPRTAAWIGAGIGPCCYGLDALPAGIPPAVVTRPRRGTRADRPYAVDLRALVRRQLQEGSIADERITTDDLCTACAGTPGAPSYHSWVRDGRPGNNLFLAWLAAGTPDASYS